jgi:hypothetical protein
MIKNQRAATLQNGGGHEQQMVQQLAAREIENQAVRRSERFFVARAG